MFRKILSLIVVLLLICLSACSFAFSDGSESVSISDTSAAASAPTYASNPTEPWICETTAANLSLPLESGSHLLRYTDKNTTDYLDYYLFIPNNAEINMPLIVFLHGDGEVGNVGALENYGMMIRAREIYGENFPFIALFPCTRVYSWTEDSVPETLFGLIESTAEELTVDRRRIIITGHSRGAMGTWNMISTYGDYFSAAVPVSCGTEVNLNYSMCAQVPVLAFAGTYGEAEVNYQNAMRCVIENLLDAGSDAELVLLQGCAHGDTCEEAYTEETFRWMLEQ